jgi:hypothetical protein
MRIWLARLLIGLVLFFNIQCAFLFLWKPEVFAPSFELAEAPGMAMVRGLGLLFLMWNVPYAVAISNPQKRRISLYEAIAMQTIALVGETFIYLTLPAAHPIPQQTLIRFIAFDAGGLAALLLAAWIVPRIAADSPGS